MSEKEKLCKTSMKTVKRGAGNKEVSSQIKKTDSQN